MNISKLKVLIILMLLIVFAVGAFARAYTESMSDKKFDATQVHNLGNIWLRVSNYGFFGSFGEDWPSLEYPGGSSIDYLFAGGLWFGAKKIKRDYLGRQYYWLNYPPNADDDYVLDNDPEWNDSLQVVVDTLVSIGIDGWKSLNELLPAYNPLEASHLGSQYTAHNYQDKSVTTSIRNQRKGVDDDNDGLIDEDPLGYAFPFRVSDELPPAFSDYGGDWLHNSEVIYGIDIITDESNNAIWFPLGFVDLSDDTNDLYNFSEPNDDDGDGIADEDGYPVSEQDFISYYYDYSPFENGNPDPDRDYDSSSGSNTHVPLNIRVRQMSYQWSYDYIKNLVYVEFNITNMNEQDTLYDCAMGIYMDSDVGPQSFGGSAIAPDDLSSYVSGEGYEFAYTYDEDKDGGLTTGYIGSRVCTPDPEELEFACWTWDVGWGPDDWQPLQYTTTTNRTANEKYWLITGKNPDVAAVIDLRTYPNAQIEAEPNGTDTRYLFGFYGAQSHTGDTDENGIEDYLEIDSNGNYFKRWNLPPGRTMKIVIAVFPGEDIPELKRTAEFAKAIYGDAQTLATVILPDISLHYQAPEPPDYPNMYAALINDGNAIGLYWTNVSEFTRDVGNVPQSVIGWQNDIPGLDSNVAEADTTNMPEMFCPSVWGIEVDNPENAVVNPWTAYRLRHDFQGYTLYGRSGSGSQEDWTQKGKWDKYESYQDLLDYLVNYGNTSFVDYQGEIGIGNENQSLPNRRLITEEDVHYYHQNEQYGLAPFEYDSANGDYTFGDHIYDYTKTKVTATEEGVDTWSDTNKALYFANPDLLNLPNGNGEEIYLELYSRSLIPLAGFVSTELLANPDKVEELRIERLSRRYYNEIISHPPKGIEYYVTVTAWDRGLPSQSVPSNESGKDAEANMKILFPGPSAKTDMDNIYVVPNPYIGQSKFDGRIENDFTGDRSRRIWFVNLPEDCTIKIYTLAGDFVDKVIHHGGEGADIINPSVALNKEKLKESDFTATGMAPWDILSHNNQIIAAGVYLFSVKDHDSGDIKVGKFVIIK